MDLNKVELIGRMAADPEARVVEDAVRCASVRLTSSRGSKDMEFLTVVMFGQLAKIAAKYLKKGDRIYVEGRLQIVNYKLRSGARRKAVEVVVHNLIMLGSKSKVE